MIWLCAEIWKAVPAGNFRNYSSEFRIWKSGWRSEISSSSQTLGPSSSRRPTQWFSASLEQHHYWFASYSFEKTLTLNVIRIQSSYSRTKGIYKISSINQEERWVPLSRIQHFALCTLHFALCTLHFALVYCTLYIVYCTNTVMYIVLCTLHILHSFCTPFHLIVSFVCYVMSVQVTDGYARDWGRRSDAQSKKQRLDQSSWWWREVQFVPTKAGQPRRICKLQPQLFQQLCPWKVQFFKLIVGTVVGFKSSKETCWVEWEKVPCICFHPCLSIVHAAFSCLSFLSLQLNVFVPIWSNAGSTGIWGLSSTLMNKLISSAINSLNFTRSRTKRQRMEGSLVNFNQNRIFLCSPRYPPQMTFYQLFKNVIIYCVHRRKFCHCVHRTLTQQRIRGFHQGVQQGQTKSHHWPR